MSFSGGFNDLPTLEFREQIVDAVDRNQVVSGDRVIVV